VNDAADELADDGSPLQTILLRPIRAPGVGSRRAFLEVRRRLPLWLDAASPLLSHDPEKCAAVFPKDHAQTKS